MTTRVRDLRLLFEDLEIHLMTLQRISRDLAQANGRVLERVSDIRADGGEVADKELIRAEDQARHSHRIEDDIKKALDDYRLSYG